MVRGVAAGDVAQVAANAFLLIDARDRLEGQVKILEVRDALQASPDDIRNVRESLLVHPVGQALAQILDDAEPVVHHGGTNLETAGTEEQELSCILPR